MWIAYVVTSEDRILDGSFEKLMNSVADQSVSTRIIVGLRDCALPLKFSSSVEATVALPFRTSLSQARNALIASHPPVEDEWVCFPDDDCWYPPGLLNKVEEARECQDFLLGVIDTGQKRFAEGGSKLSSAHINLQVALRRTASAALFVSGKKMNEFTFDERLGLGSVVGSAEDLDLVLFLLRQGSSGLFNSGIRVRHPFKPQRDGEYFEGSIAVLSKYYGQIPLARYSATRRAIKGLAFGLVGKLPQKQALKGFLYLLKKW